MAQSSTARRTWEAVKELFPGLLHVFDDESLQSLRFEDGWNRSIHLVEHSLERLCHNKVYIVYVAVVEGVLPPVD